MQTRRNRTVARQAIILAAGSAALAIAGSIAGADTITWSPGDGNWSTGTWLDTTTGSATTAPSGGTTTTPSTFSIEIDGDPDVDSTVTYDETVATVTSGELTIDSGDTLLVPSPSSGTLGSLTLGYVSSSSSSATLNNAGTIDVSDSKAYFTLTLPGHGNTPVADQPVNSGTIEVTGGGLLNLSGGAYTVDGMNNANGLISVTGKSTLELTSGPMIFGGTVTTDSSSTITSDSFSNQPLQFSNVNFNNAGLTKAYTNSASAGAYVSLAFNGDSTVNNSGTLMLYYNGASTGFINRMVFGGSYITPDGVTHSADTTSLINTGQIDITDASTISGPNTNIAQLVFSSGVNIANDGSINITNSGAGVAGGATASINIGQDTVIGNSAGKTGTIVFNDSIGNYVGTTTGFTGSTAPTLTLGPGQTLSGAVKLGMGQINLVNNGVIYANGANPIIINTQSNTFADDGSLKVANGSAMQITNTDSINALAMDPGSSVVIYIDSDTLSSGQITISGGLNLGMDLASLSIDDTGSTLLSPGTMLTIMESTGISGSFIQSQVSDALNTFDVGYSNGDVTLTVVPEPASAALLMVGCFGLMRRRRTPRQHAD